MARLADYAPNRKQLSLVGNAGNAQKANLTYYLPDGEQLLYIGSVENYYNLPAGTLTVWKNDPRKAVEEACTRWVKANNYTQETAQLVQAKQQILELLITVAQLEFKPENLDAPVLHINSYIPACKWAAEFIGLDVDRPLSWETIREFYTNSRSLLAPICVGLGIDIPDKQLAVKWKQACEEMSKQVVN